VRKFIVLTVLSLCCALTAAAQSTPEKAGPIERRLDTLAASFAKALGDRDLRELLQRSIVASETGTEVRLRDLLDREVAPGSTLAVRLSARLSAKSSAPLGASEARAAVLRLLGDTPDVDVSVHSGPQGWNVADEAPAVAYTWERSGPARDTLRAFDADGGAISLDVHSPLERPVVVLEVHDTHGAVRTAGAKPALPTLPRKDLAGCYDSATYSSYPLITGASIWDAHESSLNGPKGFLYFSAAGSEKTGNLPSTLGGLSGWSTNVWASNFQGPYYESNSRDQWEWTADGWLEYGYRTYPALYCQQTVSAPSSFTLASYTIKEDDDTFNPDDYVGKAQIDHRYCKSDVFDLGTLNGWTSVHTTAGIDDINNTSYKLYCQTNQHCSAITDCGDGSSVSCSVAGTCSAGSCESGAGYVRCGGTYRYCPSSPSCPRGQIICDPAM